LRHKGLWKTHLSETRTFAHCDADGGRAASAHFKRTKQLREEALANLSKLS
jgi:hypothetical protein